LQLALAAAYLTGVIFSWRSIRADYLFREDSETSIGSAISLVPDKSEYYMRLAQFNWKHSKDLLSTAVRLDPYNAQAYMELGLQYETEGDLVEAEKFLLKAYEVDHTYMPRWSLANYYFRHGNLTAFWTWARSAAALPSDDTDSLFELCWLASPDPQAISAAISNDKPEFLRQYLTFLLSKDQAQAASVVALSLVRNGVPDQDRTLMLNVVDKLIASGDAGSALSVWHSLSDRKWIAADNTIPNNAAFARTPLPVGFDWSLPEDSGLHSWTGPLGLKTEFSGLQPEDCTIAEQTVALAKGTYAFDFSYYTGGIHPDTGVRWEIADAKSAAVLAKSPDLSSDGTKQVVLPFSVGPDMPLLRLRLVYRRALGTPRISGTLVVRSTGIHSRQSL